MSEYFPCVMVVFLIIYVHWLICPIPVNAVLVRSDACLVVRYQLIKSGGNGLGCKLWSPEGGMDKRVSVGNSACVSIQKVNKSNEYINSRRTVVHAVLSKHQLFSCVIYRYNSWRFTDCTRSGTGHGV